MNKFAKHTCGILAALSIPLVCATDLSAKPAVKTPITVTQPDGSSLSIRLHGDEFFHFSTTTDGHLIMNTPDKGYVYAEISRDGIPVATSMRAHDANERTEVEKTFLSSISSEAKGKAIESMRRETISRIPMQKERKSAMLQPGHKWELGRYSYTYPVTGSPKALVVLVEYTDVKFSIDDPHAYFEALLNEEGFSVNGGTGSASDWFKYNSNGKFAPEFDLYGPIKLANNRRYYGGNDRYGNDSNPEEMVIEAIDAIDDEVDLSQYDTNNDGYIDNVFVFYAGKGEADSGIEDTVWPHSYDIEYARPGFTFEYDGVLLNHYACSNEFDSQYRRPDGIGTFVHEFSHVMGLPDLYATTYTNAVTPGQYSVLDYGPYNNKGRTPPNYSSFERNALGWLTPKVFMEDEEITLEPLAETNDCYLIPTEADNEFFLLEYRPLKGNDMYIPAGGMIVWQIDYDEEKWLYNGVNNNDSHQNVMMLKADGKNSTATLSGDTFPGKSGNTTLSYTTRPSLRSWGRNNLGVTIDGITEEDDVIKFNVTLDENYNRPDSNKVEGMDEAAPFSINGMTVSAADDITVFNINGNKVCQLKAGESSLIPTKGIYIISSKGNNRKVIL